MNTITLEKKNSDGFIRIDKRLIVRVIWEGLDETNCRIILSTGVHYIVEHDPNSKCTLDFPLVQYLANNNRLKRL